MSNSTHKKKKIYKNKILPTQKENHGDSKKIILNDMTDLINIPVEQLRTAQFSYFSGPLFQKIFEEAVEMEHENGNNQKSKSKKKIEKSPLTTKRKISGLDKPSGKLTKVTPKSRAKSKTPLKKTN